MYSLLLYKTRKEFFIVACARCCLWSLTLLHLSFYFWVKKPINYISQMAYLILLVGITDGRIKGRREEAAILFPSYGQQWQHWEQQCACPGSGSAARLWQWQWPWAWGHDFPFASLRALNSFIFGTPSSSTTFVTHYLYHIESPLKYWEYFPLSWLDTGCYTDTVRPRQANNSAWAHIHIWLKAYIQSFLEL